MSPFGPNAFKISEGASQFARLFEVMGGSYNHLNPLTNHDLSDKRKHLTRELLNNRKRNYIHNLFIEFKNPKPVAMESKHMGKSPKRNKYSEAGVDLDAGNKFVELIKPIVSKTFRSGVITDIGGFAGLFSLKVQDIKNPVLVSSTDGVGTKLKIAFMLDKHDTVGIDLVAMCVNDIMVQGANPLFFLDYISIGKLEVNKARDIVKGIAAGCQEANCSLIGGETAEMPGFYAEGEYDVAGFVVGLADNEELLDGSEVAVGHQLIGISSSGLHSNGYSLVRKIFFEGLKMSVKDYVEDFGRTLGEELLEPTRIYARTISNLRRDFKIYGIAHITGGGLIDNVPRMLPKPCKAIINGKGW